MIVPCLPPQLSAAACPASGASSRPQAASRAATKRRRWMGTGDATDSSIGREEGKIKISQVSVMRGRACRNHASDTRAARMKGGLSLLNFYSAVFVDQLKRGRKTATIRLG